jgi:anti-sigma factor RsiW
MFACSEVLDLSDAFIDGELFPEARAWVLGHLLQCAKCAALIETRVRLKRRVHNSAIALTAPASLKARLQIYTGGLEKC